MNYLPILLVFITASGQISYEECKRHCTLDWLDCGTGCQSINNPQHCHLNCQKYVASCQLECPKIVCQDKCRVKLEQCRNSSTSCEELYEECELTCLNAYNQVVPDDL